MSKGTLVKAAPTSKVLAPLSSVPTIAGDLRRLWEYWFHPDPARIAAGMTATNVGSRVWPLWEYTTEEELALQLEAYNRSAEFKAAQRQLNYLKDGMSQVLDTFPVLLEATIPYDEETSAPMRLLLPSTFLGGDDHREMISELVRKRLGGKWKASWHQDTYPPYATFAWQPPVGHPPRYVSWALSNDPWSVFVGETVNGPKFVNFRTQTPHWGVTAGTGGGKTTTLALPITHVRLNLGALVDIIDLKEDSFDDYFEDVKGIRIHRSAEAAVMAIAEFFTSIKGIRTAKLKGYDVSQIPPRFLVLDELGSFVLAAETWWKYGIQGKGAPPFLAMFHMILMQGRTKNHRVVVGTHQFSLATFKSTDARDLIGNKLVVGPCSAPKWGTTYGLDVTRIKYDGTIPGRGAIGITGSGETVEEIQLAYLSPDEAHTHLDKLEAPSWFENGEMAPWIDTDSIELATREGYAGPFLPGGQFITPGMSLVPGKRALQVLPSSVQDAIAATPELPELSTQVTLQEAIERGYVHSVNYENLRKLSNRDGEFPATVGKRGNAKLYDAGELEIWDTPRRA